MWPLNEKNWPLLIIIIIILYLSDIEAACSIQYNKLQYDTVYTQYSFKMNTYTNN